MSETCGCLFFFFQAEDGIRRRNVTGVQTCALPISSSISPAPAGRNRGRPPAPGSRRERSGATAGYRSEERRVGKECRSRRSAHHFKNKMEKDRSGVFKNQRYATAGLRLLLSTYRVM